MQMNFNFSRVLEGIAVVAICSGAAFAYQISNTMAVLSDDVRDIKAQLSDFQTRELAQIQHQHLWEALESQQKLDQRQQEHLKELDNRVDNLEDKVFDNGTSS